jgi:hypothetical protein
MCIRIILWSTIGGRGEFVLKQTAHFVLKFDLEVQSVPAGLVGGRVIEPSDAAETLGDHTHYTFTSMKMFRNSDSQEFL